MKNNSGNNLKYYLELSKLKIMIPVSLTGFTGYFIFDPHLTLNIFIVSTGILLMAVSASVLNQIQEVELDRKMNRTQNRPIPAMNIKHVRGTIIFPGQSDCRDSYLFILPEASELQSSGLITLLWYNGIYTYSKRITAFAVVPGAVTGALPPLIGWVAAGGGIWDKPIIFLEFLFFIRTDTSLLASYPEIWRGV